LSSQRYRALRVSPSFPTRRSSDLGRVLDVGAGIGQLLPRLDPRFVTEYIALDISSHALAQLPASDIPASRLNANIVARPLPSQERYDAIVASEVLYYLEDPMGVLDRLCENLSETGCLIISMGRPPPGREKWVPIIDGIWQDLDRSEWVFQDEVILTDVPSDLTWRVRVVRAPVEPATR